MEWTSSQVFICGATRNCGKYLKDVFSNIKKVVDLFADFHIIISFDVSEDDTLLVLGEYKQEFGDKMDILINTKPLDTKHLENIEVNNFRAINISNARNAYIEKMREKIKSGYMADYFIAMDMDDVCSGSMDIDVLRRVMDKNDEWDSVSFNHKRYGYYDLWAYSDDFFIYGCWGFHTGWVVTKMMKDCIEDKLSKMSTDEFMECKSAFNGFAVYKTSKFLDCCYDWHMPKQYMDLELIQHQQRCIGLPTISPLDEQTDETDCEHRAFHMMATDKNDARIRISPLCLF